MSFDGDHRQPGQQGGSPDGAPHGYPGAAPQGAQGAAQPGQYPPQGPYPQGQGAPQPGAHPPQNPYVQGQAGPYPQGAYPVPGSPAPREPMTPGKKKALLWGIVGGVVLILLIVAAVVVGAVLKQQAEQREAEAQAKAVSAAVEDYLQALADGDSEAALSHLIEPESSPLLTDEVLAVSNEAAPIGGIEVAQVDPEDIADHVGGWDITASFTVGDEPVDVSFPVSDSGRDDGDYGILGGLASLQLPAAYAGIGAAVNGVAIEGDSAAVFPGAYELTISDDRFVLSGSTTATVAAPFESGSFSDIGIALSDDAVKSLRSALKDEVDGCVASKKLEAGCGLTMDAKINNGDVTLEDGTVKRSLPGSTKSALKKASFTVSASDPLTVTSDFLGTVDLEADGTSSSGASGRYELYFGGPSLGSATIDLSGKKPSFSWDG